jgi:hypothetical protein
MSPELVLVGSDLYACISYLIDDQSIPFSVAPFDFHSITLSSFFICVGVDALLERLSSILLQSHHNLEIG